MKANQRRIEIFKDHSVSLYFLDKYLLHNSELENDKLIIHKQSSNNEPFELATKMLKSEMSSAILQKHGYVLLEQPDGDICVKSIF